MKNICKILLLTALATIGNIVWGAEKDPGETVKAMMKESMYGDANNAVEYMDLQLEADRSGENIEKVRSQMIGEVLKERKRNNNYDGYEIKIIKVSYVNSDKTIAKVEVVAISKKRNSEEKLELTLNKRTDGWKIQLL